MGLRARLLALPRFADATALIAGDARWSYQELDLRARRAGAALAAAGVAPGDRVAVCAASSAEHIAAIVAVHHVGAILVPINPRASAPELRHVLEDSGASILLADSTTRPTLIGLTDRRVYDVVTLSQGEEPPALAVADEDIAAIVYTSGTTGRSKGAALSWRALVTAMATLGAAWGLGPGDRVSHALPLFHVHGLCVGIYASLLHGVAIALHSRFLPSTLLDDLAAGATVVHAVPTMYSRLLETLALAPELAPLLARARLFTAGSAALSPDVHAAFVGLGGPPILERYGMTETLITISNPLAGERRPGSVGLPLPGVEIRIVDDDGCELEAGTPGELQIAGPTLMTGYWNAPEATRAAFDGRWFRTGDTAIRGPDGYVQIIGRTSLDIIKSGGFKVGAREIEDVLARHPHVVEVAVIGRPDPEWGERVVAVVVARPGVDSAALAPTLAELARLELTHYKQPREIVFVDALPRNAMGKVEKAKLRATLSVSAAPDP